MRWISLKKRKDSLAKKQNKRVSIFNLKRKALRFHPTLWSSFCTNILLAGLKSLIYYALLHMHWNFWSFHLTFNPILHFSFFYLVWPFPSVVLSDILWGLWWSPGPMLVLPSVKQCWLTSYYRNLLLFDRPIRELKRWLYDRGPSTATGLSFCLWTIYSPPDRLCQNVKELCWDKIVGV